LDSVEVSNSQFDCGIIFFAIIFSMMQPGLVEVFHAVSDVFTETNFSRNTNAYAECFA
jgi:hypothetical protein